MSTDELTHSLFSSTKDYIKSLEADSQLVQTKRGPIEYAKHGQGPAVITLHASPGGYDQAIELSRDLQSENFTLVAWSRPGYLRTPLSVGQTFREQADAMALLLDELHIQKVAVIAVSTGGACGLEFANRHPDRITALIMHGAMSHKYFVQTGQLMKSIMPKVLSNNFGPGFYNALANYAPQTAIKMLVKTIMNVRGQQLQQAVAEIMNDPKKINYIMAMVKTTYPSHLRAPGLENDLTQYAELKPILIQNIRCPTLIVHGTADEDVPFDHANYLANTMPHAELYPIENGRHILNLSSQAGEISKRKIAFLKKYNP